MNTYTGNFSDFVIKSSATEVTSRRSSTLPKKFTHAVNQSHSQTLGIREAFKSKATIFGTLFRPKKIKKSVSSPDSTFRKSPELPVQTLVKSDNAVNYVDGRLVSGRMPELIELLAPTHEYYPESNYIFTFILCSRLFTPPYKVLQQVKNRIQNTIAENKEHETSILKNFLQLLVEWTESFPYDFQHKEMMQSFNEACRLCTKDNPNFCPNVNRITAHLVLKLQSLLQYVETLTFHIQCDEEDQLLFDVCRDPLVLSQQLTIIEFNKLSKIYPEQFVEKFVAGQMTCSRLDLTEKTSSLELYVSWFNRLSYLIATEICMCPKKKERVKLIDFFIDVGKHCFKCGNFNSLMAIVVGLNMNAVQRMRKTWQKTNEAGFKKLEDELGPEGNFSKYRQTLQQRIRFPKHNEYVIPVFSILVKDVYFLNEGIKSKVDNLINFDKFSRISNHIKGLVELKDKFCNYDRDEKVLEYLYNTPVCNEEGIYKSSFEVEPPESNFERDRYRSVRIKVGNR